MGARLKEEERSREIEKKEKEFSALESSLLALNAGFEAARMGDCGERWATEVERVRNVTEKTPRTADKAKARSKI